MTHVLEVASRGRIFGLAAAFALVPAQAVAAFALRLGGTDVGEVWVLRGRFGSSAVALVAAYCALLVVPQALPAADCAFVRKMSAAQRRSWALQVAKGLASAPLRATAGTVGQAGRVCPRALSLAVCVAGSAVVEDLAALGVSAVPLLEEAASGLADWIDHRRTLCFLGLPRPQVREVAFGLRVLGVLAAAERLVLTQRPAQLLIVARAR